MHDLYYNGPSSYILFFVDSIPITDKMLPSTIKIEKMNKSLSELTFVTERFIEGNQNFWKLQEQAWTKMTLVQAHQEQNKHILPLLNAIHHALLRTFECHNCKKQFINVLHLR